MDNDGLTPLLLAVRNRHATVVKLLLATDGVDPDSMDNIGWTPLSLAAGNGYEAVLKLLLARGAETRAKDIDRRAAFHLAAESGHLDAVKLLLDRGAEIEAKNAEDRTPLHLAAQNMGTHCELQHTTATRLGYSCCWKNRTRAVPGAGW